VGANYLLDTESTSAVWEQSTLLVLLNYATLSFAVVLTLWGTGRIARRLEALRMTTANVLETSAAREPFREMISVVGPLVTSAVTAIAFFARRRGVPGADGGSRTLMASGRRFLRPVRMPVPPHPHEEPQAVVQTGGSSSQAAGRGGSRSGRASRRGLRRVSSTTTFAGRGGCLGRAATRTRCSCISSPLSEARRHSGPR
jgi:hypothetical protein